eukprot:jgi/Tetstr1/462155/TSEL_007220.t1
MAKVWAPFDCAHISENPSFNTMDRLEVVYPHLHGKLTRFPIEFFPLATNSPCFSVGNLPQTVRHFGFSDTAANKIAPTLDMVPTKVFTSTAASGVRKLWVRALPEPHNEHAYADRKRALKETNGSHGAWPETSWQDAVESVLFVECQSRTVKQCGYSIRSVREWHNDYEMRRGIQQIKNKRFTKSTNTCQPCRGSSAPRTVLVDNRYYQGHEHQRLTERTLAETDPGAADFLTSHKNLMQPQEDLERGMGVPEKDMPYMEQYHEYMFGSYTTHRGPVGAPVELPSGSPCPKCHGRGNVRLYGQGHLRGLHGCGRADDPTQCTPLQAAYNETLYPHITPRSNAAEKRNHELAAQYVAHFGDHAVLPNHLYSDEDNANIHARAKKLRLVVEAAAPTVAAAASIPP